MKHERGEKELVPVPPRQVCLCLPLNKLPLCLRQKVFFQLICFTWTGVASVECLKCLPLSSLQPLTDLIVLVSSISDINHI